MARPLLAALPAASRARWKLVPLRPRRLLTSADLQRALRAAAAPLAYKPQQGAGSSNVCFSTQQAAGSQSHPVLQRCQTPLTASQQPAAVARHEHGQ